MQHEAISAGKLAVITGGAAGLGLAAATRFAQAGMSVAIIDQNDAEFEAVAAALTSAGAPAVVTRKIDVSDRAGLVAFEAELADKFGGADVLMGNAGIGLPSNILDTDGVWQKVLNVNLWGIINVCQTFLPRMIKRETAGLIINTGSKQGITTPPGNPAYNISKAGVKAFTEALAHDLRQTAPYLSAHLFVPGFVFSNMTRPFETEKPPAAWTPEETIDYMLGRLDQGDFYILCPDNDVSTETDKKRVAWAAGDITQNRPALSRWHPDWADTFAQYMKDT